MKQALCTVIRLTSDNFNSQLCTVEAYAELRLQMSTGDFHTHQAIEVQVDSHDYLGMHDTDHSQGVILTLSMIQAQELLTSTEKPTKWTEEYSNKQCHYKGIRIAKSLRHSLYWVHYSTHCAWAAPHSEMSQAFRSLVSAKRFIDGYVLREQAAKPDFNNMRAYFEIHQPENLNEYIKHQAGRAQ